MCAFNVTYYLVSRDSVHIRICRPPSVPDGARIRGDAAALAARERFERVTLESLAVMDEVRRQAGVRFPADLR